MSYSDGTFTTAKQNGPRRIQYPFANGPIADIYARIYEREMFVLSESFVTSTQTRASMANGALWSNDPSNAAWTKVEATATAAIFPHPATGVSASAGRIVESAGTGQHYIGQVLSIPATTTSIGVAVYPDGRTIGRLLLSNGTDGDVAYNLFDLTSLTASGPGSKSVKLLGNGWYWIECTGLPTVTNSGIYFQMGDASGNLSYTGNGSSAFGVCCLTASIGSYAVPLDTTSALVSASIPNLEINEADGNTDPFAYLVGESDLSTSGGVGAFRRTHARIPVPQITPSSRGFMRPLMDDVFSGGSYAVSFDGEKSWVFTSRKSISSIGALTLGTVSKSIASSARSLQSLPAVLATFAEGAHSTAIYVNTAASTFQSSLASALTGLTNITVTATETSVTITWTGTMKYINAPSSNYLQVSGGAGTGSITFSTPSEDPSRTDTDAPNQDPSIRDINCTGHGGQAGDLVVFWKGSRVVAKSTVIAVASADVFSVIAADVDGKDLTLDYCGFAPDAAACYVSGYKVCTTRKTRTFYLPGYTSGITTYADIPTQTVYTDAQSWLGRIVAASTWVNIEVSDVSQWIGPILQQEITEIQMDDALDTVTP